MGNASINVAPGGGGIAIEAVYHVEGTILNGQGSLSVPVGITVDPALMAITYVGARSVNTAVLNTTVRATFSGNNVYFYRSGNSVDCYVSAVVTVFKNAKVQAGTFAWSGTSYNFTLPEAVADVNKTLLFVSHNSNYASPGSHPMRARLTTTQILCDAISNGTKNTAYFTVEPA